MSSNISMNAGSLLALVLEGVVYGFSMLMFIGTIWGLTYKQRMQDVSRPIAMVAILLFILSTVHIVASTIRAEDALVTYANTFPGGPAAFFADLTQPTVKIKGVTYVLQTLLADGIMIYRCYIVWQSVLVIVLPSILWCGLAVVGVGMIYSFLNITSTSNSGDIAINLSGQYMHWASAFTPLTLATNLLSSGLIAYHIWKIERNVSAVRSKKSTMMPIVRILVDSAVLYTVMLFILLVCFICSNNGEYVIADMLIPTISITFYMVLVRVAINRKYSYSSTIGITRDNSRQYHMQPLQVHIPQFTHNCNTVVYGVGDKHQPSTFTTESKKGTLES
ncbi:hypothetical protein BDR07DRAFT_1399556 [Suillus spraguei]|nr:hypothetical protein BDR07DRAFT_1399556 [Suillus spraguei]